MSYSHGLYAFTFQPDINAPREFPSQVIKDLILKATATMVAANEIRAALHRDDEEIERIEHQLTLVSREDTAAFGALSRRAYDIAERQKPVREKYRKARDEAWAYKNQVDMLFHDHYFKEFNL